MAESISLPTIGLKSKKKRKNWPETGPSDSRRETLKSRTGLNGIYGPSGRNRDAIQLTVKGGGEDVSRLTFDGNVFVCVWVCVCVRVSLVMRVLCCVDKASGCHGDWMEHHFRNGQQLPYRHTQTTFIFYSIACWFVFYFFVIFHFHFRLVQEKIP
jgi:hypothetical protein